MKKLYMMMLAAAAALMTGCVATPVPPMDTRVTIAPDLGHKLYVTDVRCTKGHSDFLTLQVNAVNNTGSELRVQWKVVWLDGEGMEIDSLVSSWNSLALQPHEIRGLKGTAPRVDAADMRFYARKMP
jgi:uncharacterized protein YcfL